VAPALWRGDGTGPWCVARKPAYLNFLSAGILAQSVLFVAIFYGISAIWERDLGVLRRYLISPPPPFCAGSRQSLVGGCSALASIHRLAPRSSRNDAAIRNQILNDIGKQSWSAGSRVDVIVRNGIVDLWGSISDVAQREALKVLVENSLA
jgi:hypothetical protein